MEKTEIWDRIQKTGRQVRRKRQRFEAKFKKQAVKSGEKNRDLRQNSRNRPSGQEKNTEIWDRICKTGRYAGKIIQRFIKEFEKQAGAGEFLHAPTCF